MKKRLKEILFPFIAPITLGIIYAIWLRFTGLGIPCIFRLLTGFECPGCGITRMCMAILSGDISAAKEANILLFYMLPVLFICWVLYTAHFILTGQRYTGILTHVFLYGAVAMLLIFGVWRNLM